MSAISRRSTELGIALLRAGLGTMWVAYPLFAAALLGELAIVVGLYARQLALVLAPVMAVVISVHAANGWVHTAPGGGWEYPAFLLLASLALWLAGDGAFSLRRSTRMVPAL